MLNFVLYIDRAVCKIITIMRKKLPYLTIILNACQKVRRFIQMEEDVEVSYCTPTRHINLLDSGP